MTRWLIDGSNVVGSRPDGWWRDRRAAFQRLTVELAGFARSVGDPVTVVFDGEAGDEAAETGAPTPAVVVAWAPSADDRITALVQGDSDPRSLTVVTSDRGLRSRVEVLGATVVGAGAFRRRLDESARRADESRGMGRVASTHRSRRGGSDMGDTGPESGAKGAVEGMKGKAKEAAGVVSGNEGLEQEGEAQQDKAEAQRDVASKEAEAEKARAEAAGHEAKQRANQQ